MLSPFEAMRFENQVAKILKKKYDQFSQKIEPILVLKFKKIEALVCAVQLDVFFYIYPVLIALSSNS